MLYRKTIFRAMAALCGLFALATLTACGNGSSSSGPRLYAADTGNNQLERVDDFAGTNWTTYGSAGSGTGQFTRPSGIAFDSTNHIYVVDSGNSRIVRTDNFSGGNFTTYGGLGNTTTAGQFNRPSQIAIDTLNRIYITDTANNRVVRINDITGAGWTILGGGTTGNASGAGTGQFNGPTGIALDSANNIYVADTGNNRIVEFSDMAGTNWTVLGGTLGTSTGQFNGPQGVTTDATGHIYISDSGNNRIVEVNGIGGAGWTTYGTFGNGYGNFSNPTAIQTYTAGTTTYIYVADTGNSRVVRMDNITGLNEALFGSAGIGIDNFSSPLGIAIHN